MASLEVVFAGTRMRNPIGIAPHGLTYHEGHIPQRLADHLMRYVDAGAGYVYHPITVPERKMPKKVKAGTSRCFRAEVRGFGTRLGFFDVCDVTNIVHRLDESLETINILKPKLPENVPLIGDPQGSGVDIESWVEVAKELEQAGADILELNMSCPLGMLRDITKVERHYVDIPPEISPEMAALGLNAVLGDTPSAIGPIVKAVTDAVNIPVGVKPSPEAGFPRIVAIFKAIANNGGKFVTNINCPITFAPPDIYNGGKGKFPKFGGLNPMCTTYGPWDRWLSLKYLGAGVVYVPELDYAAVGGIVIPEHMIEMMMLGAKIIQLSSALFFDGLGVLPRFIKFLDDYMEKQSYEKVDDFIGLAKQYIKPIDETTEWYIDNIVASVDKGLCTQCGNCTPNLCFAIPTVDNEGYPKIDESTCVACARCVAICPSDAISIVDR